MGSAGDRRSRGRSQHPRQHRGRHRGADLPRRCLEGAATSGRRRIRERARRYRQTLLVAFGQVADILRALQHDAELLGSETAAVTASKASLELAQDAYAAGRGSLVQVLDAQRLYAQALLGYARAKGQRYLDTVLLFEAMGGDSQAWVEARDRARP
ncbi:MAG: hypothetical protein DMD75_25150 [Candidatus Rokuibacteriota bacterium]|nr:MAG: hypothetical protein DMD75_25150 [Candidatus Rokubacteria bacterium]